MGVSSQSSFSSSSAPFIDLRLISRSFNDGYCVLRRRGGLNTIMFCNLIIPYSAVVDCRIGGAAAIGRRVLKLNYVARN